MMKQFNISRFGSLLSYDARMFGPQIAMWCLLFLVFAPFLHTAMGTYFALGTAQAIYLSIMPLAFMGIAIEMICSKFVKADTATYYVTLPATTIEKWAATVLEALFFLVVVKILVSNIAIWIVQAIVAHNIGSPIRLEIFFSNFVMGASNEWQNINAHALPYLSFVVLAVRYRMRLGQIAMIVAYACFRILMSMCLSEAQRLLGPEFRPLFIWFIYYGMPLTNVALLYYSYRLVRQINVY